MHHCRWLDAKGFAAIFLCSFTALPVAAHEGGHNNEVMWQACENRALNDSCVFENSAHQINRGSCQMMVDNLICVRNQPIETAASVQSAQPAKSASPTQSAYDASDPGKGDASFGLFGWLAAILAAVIAGAVLLYRRKANSSKLRRDQDS